MGLGILSPIFAKEPRALSRIVLSLAVSLKRYGRKIVRKHMVSLLNQRQQVDFNRFPSVLLSENVLEVQGM